MGGLVTRPYVKKAFEEFPLQAENMALVVTVNSPMGGMPSATSGVELSPIVVPAWRDLAPGSGFLNDLHTWPWPESLPYHLVFSYQPGEGSDGVVALQSQIPWQLQQEAQRVYGFTGDHVSTLSDEGFLSLFNDILESRFKLPQ